jgi:hypothetical protein
MTQVKVNLATSFYCPYNPDPGASLRLWIQVLVTSPAFLVATLGQGPPC